MHSIPLPHLSYSISRDFKWRLEPYVYALSVVALVILVPVNVALSGYQVITTTSTDFNAVPDLWFYKFGGRPTPGTLCDPYRFDTGEVFATNYSILPWMLGAVTASSTSGIRPFDMYYSGQTLEDCDVSYLSLDVDARTWMATAGVQVYCNHLEFMMMAAIQTAWTFTTLSGNPGPTNWSPLAENATSLVIDANEDALNNLLNVTALLGQAAPAYIGVDAEDITLYCPPTIQEPLKNSSCLTTPPNIAQEPGMYVSGNGTVITPQQLALLPSNYSTAATNVLQIMLAIARIDIGHILPNNVITNPSILDSVIAKDIPIDGVPGGSIPSQLYADLKNGRYNLTRVSQDIGVPLSGPAIINVNYTCHFQAARTPGEIIVSTTVATFSIGTTAWGITMIVVMYFYKRKESNINVCEGCADIESRPLLRMSVPSENTVNTVATNGARWDSSASVQRVSLQRSTL